MLNNPTEGKVIKSFKTSPWEVFSKYNKEEIWQAREF